MRPVRSDLRLRRVVPVREGIVMDTNAFMILLVFFLLVMVIVCTILAFQIGYDLGRKEARSALLGTSGEKRHADEERGRDDGDRRRTGS